MSKEQKLLVDIAKIIASAVRPYVDSPIEPERFAWAAAQILSLVKEE